MSTRDADGASIEGIHAARERIAGYVRETPMLRKDTLGDRFGQPIHVKCEHLQRTGSFKLRGAINLIAQLTPEERARGVVAASAGNHAQGVAVAAAQFGVHATIYMPEDASLSKVDATRGYGADVRLEGENLSSTLEAAGEFAEQSGATFVHPFDDVRIIEGQGTLGLEVLEQVPDVHTVVIPIGGGGLFAGVATVLRALKPDVRIIGVQAAACQSLRASLDAGMPVTVEAHSSMADGIAVKQPGERTFAVIRDTIDELVHVEEEDISTAILWSMERAKQVVEGAGAAALAALLAGRFEVGGGPTVIMSCGGNVDPVALLPVIRHGLTAVGRFLYLGTVIEDRPGELSRLLAMLASLKVNILSVEHHREGFSMRVGDTRVDLVLQTRNRDHVDEVLRSLREAGYPIHRES